MSLLFLILVAFPILGEKKPPISGLVVTHLPDPSHLREIGIRQGDIFYAWRGRNGAGGGLEHPFDWLWMVAAQAPRPPITLTGSRNGEELEIEVPMVVWDAEVQPTATGDGNARLQRIHGLLQEENLKESQAILSELVADTSWQNYYLGGFHLQHGKPGPAGGGRPGRRGRRRACRCS